MNLRRSIETFDLIFLDLETTGLIPVGDSICEIGALKIKERKVIDKFHSLINPKRNISYEAYFIHGISDEELKDAPSFEQVVDKFLIFLRDSVICVYNAEFDMSFIQGELARISHPSLQLPVMDILCMARRTLRLPKYNLGAIAQFFGIKSPHRLHRALDDAAVTSRVFFKLRDILKEKKLENLDDFISLYGFNNEVFKLKEEPKVFLIKEAITKGAILKTRYFSFGNTMREEKLKPLNLFQEKKNFYLWCENSRTSEFRLNLNRILEVEII